MKNLQISFDVGHSSIGWAVLLKLGKELFPAILGTGAVIFDDDSCQTKKRAGYRRMRRNIASRRERIKLLRKVFLLLNVLSAEELDNSKQDFPWLLAAKVLKGARTLTWEEMWSVIRFYAHNRGYDGNSAWAKNEDSDEGKEDIKKEEAAKALMQKFNTQSMSETMCTFLDIDIFSDIRPNPKKYFKGENVAFPRNVVMREVEQIIDAHIGILPKCDENFKKLIMGKWREVDSDISLPKNFTDDRGLLFGQYVPRFDNRIIKKCPISGNKVPSCHSRDFFEYRWKMILSNLYSADSAPRKVFLERLDELAHVYGRFTKTTFERVLKENFGAIPENFDAMFLTDEMASALLVDPVKDIILKTICKNISRELPSEAMVKKLWSVIPSFVFTQMFRMKAFSLSDIASKLVGGKSEELKNIVLEILSSAKPKRGEERTSFEDIFNLKMRIAKLKGRAPYSRQLMKKACEEIMDCKDPRSIGGALYMTAELEKSDLLSNVDTWTNNHLVRHRLKMLKRLFMNIVNRYADGNISNVKTVTIEVVKDITEFSGMSIKEKGRVLQNLILHHNSVSKYLKEEYPELDQNASVIRKARIADDMGWICPYTGKAFSPRELFEEGVMEIEHIIPYSLRPSNSLDSLVMTWKEVNDMKGQRTALEFVKEFEGQSVPGRPELTIISLSRYKEFVKGLRCPKHKYAEADQDRIKRRKKLLLTEKYDKRESSFLPSDLTHTSHINKLAFKAIKSFYVNEEKMPEFIHLPGSITSAVRKNWNLLSCMSEACPDIFCEVKSDDAKIDKRLKTKDEIRSITHLHHAVDAITMGLTSVLFPTTKHFYELLLKRRLSDSERDELRATGLFVFSKDKWDLIDIPEACLDNIKDAVSEGRIVKHLPKKMSGLRVQETLWRVVKENDDGTVDLRQYTMSNGVKSRRETKLACKNKIKLLGYDLNGLRETKLSRNKSVYVIEDNFGVALTNPPVIIPFVNVWRQLQALAEKNGGKEPDVLRKNNLIEIKSGTYKGVWRVDSVKNNASGLALDLAKPAYVGAYKINVLLKTLMKNGLRIIETDFVGV